MQNNEEIIVRFVIGTVPPTINWLEKAKKDCKDATILAETITKTPNNGKTNRPAHQTPSSSGIHVRDFGGPGRKTNQGKS